MLNLSAADPRAAALVTAIRTGDVDGLRAHLGADPELAWARIVDDGGVGRTLLHVVADWPGHFPRAADIVAVLIGAGVPVDAGLEHPRRGGAPETALHWAASSDDLAVLDALLDGGADLEAPGAIFTGGTALSDAVVFAQWRAARRLLERGARTTLWQAAALGLADTVRQHLAADPPPALRELSNALWNACRGGQVEVAALLHARGADLHWSGHDHKTPLDVARESGSVAMVEWLEERGATPGGR